MDSAQVSQQTSVSHPAHQELGRDAPLPAVLHLGSFRGPLQWVLEGRGHALVRPALDLVLLCSALLAAEGSFSAIVHPSRADACLLTLPALVMLSFSLRGMYRVRLRALVLDGVVSVISGVSVAAMTAAMLGLLAEGQLPDQRRWLYAWLFSLLAVSLGRITLAALQRWTRARRLVGRPVLIVGAGMVGAQVARRLEHHPEYGLMPIGFLDEDPRSVAEVGGRDTPVLGTIDDLDEMVARTGVRNLIVAFSSAADARVSRLIQHCQEVGIKVWVVPRMFDTVNDRVVYDTVGGLPIMCFSAPDLNGPQFAVKHALDYVLALALLVLLSPVLLAVAVAVRLSSPGPILFRQRRVGRDGRLFDLYKFRSMRGGPEEQQEDEESIGALDLLLGGDTAPGGVEGDDRRTSVGRVLRRTSLDELPQLLNVLRGEMSIIGPRPERPEFVEIFREDIARYGDRHRVKSGITGWAQVHGLRGQTSLAERVEWDNYYIAHWSLGLDLKIIALTFTAVFHRTE